MSTAGRDPASTPGSGGRVLAVLWAVYVFNFVDRNILSILLEPIKLELGASDTAMGVLTGFAFAVFCVSPTQRASSPSLRFTYLGVISP